jgi:hypothetical protein
MQTGTFRFTHQEGISFVLFRMTLRFSIPHCSIVTVVVVIIIICYPLLFFDGGKLWERGKEIVPREKKRTV